MKPVTKLDRQVKALIAFSESFDKRGNPKPIPHLRWREKWTEPALHHRWRIHANLLARTRLWVRCGFDELPGLKLRSIERRERKARRAWQEEDRCEREEFLRSRTAMMEGLAPYEGDQR
jgi:hypothetical protein